MNKLELQVSVEALTQLTPSRNLSTLPAKQIEDKEFTFIRSIINKTYMTPEEIALVEGSEAKLVDKIRATTFVYAGAGTTIGLRANSLLGLRSFKGTAATKTTAHNALAAASKKGTEAELYETVGEAMYSQNEEMLKGNPDYLPSFPVSFKVIAAIPVTLNVMQEGTDEPAKAYPMQAYVKFQEEIDKRTALRNNEIAAGAQREPFNVGELYADVNFRNSLRGTALVNGGVGATAYQSVYIKKVSL